VKVTWKSELPLLILIAAMFAAAWLTWPVAPDRIPVHWGLKGDPDRWGGRFEGLMLPPLAALGLYAMMLLLPRLDPGRMNYERFAGAYYTIRASVVAITAVVDGVTLAAIRGLPVDVPRTLGLSIGVMFFVFGNVLGKVRPNWFVGVRTPWTLSSKRSWTRTHRLAGWVFVWAGLAIMVAGVVQTPFAVATAGTVLVGGILAAVVYSYLVWKDDPDRVPPAGTLPSNGD
jgi:uncharacterized membrane protein